MLLIFLKQKAVFICLLFAAISALAQTPDEALRTAWYTANGTARNMATGGVMGSLGGDITAAHVNPAGLGFFKTREWVLSPGMWGQKNALQYRGTDSNTQKNVFNYGTMGWVFGAGASQNPNGSWTSSAFSISINQLANYHNNLSFTGFNNKSSFSEQYLEELVADGADTTAALSNYIFGSSLAFRTYLIDTLRAANGSVNGFKTLVPASGVQQLYQAATRGGMHEIAVGFATNTNDVWHWGGSITIPIVQYRRTLTYSETDVSGIANNGFGYFTYHEQFQSSGAGVGLKLGTIYKPRPYVRFGLALHTPQLIGMRDQIRSSMVANTENYAGVHTESSDNLNDGKAGIRKYVIVTPLRLIVSGSYVFREVADTRKQRAFISADVEYVRYKGARLKPDDAEDAVAESYLQAVNGAIKNTYQNNLNVRVGGELKLNIWMFRLGGAFYGSPYAEKILTANRYVASCGIGYRNHGRFIDVSYARTWLTDYLFPYRLSDKANTFAQQNGQLGNVTVTFGVKF